ncbi:MAG: hypothetical protein ACD_22C00230G0005 [uncultured bacterium]|nr:MAG: hypothetical protein ACD_22C00230G0005 [uncultured bacterium]
MFRKLTAKIQKINPILPANTNRFANVLAIDPGDELLLEKRGTIYTVFDISSAEEFDTALVSKVVADVLHDSYYQSDNISPIQSLEKAIVDVRDKVTKLTNESIRTREATVTFNILAGVLWGNVMYVVCYGNASSYLMREGVVKPISSNSEGHFSAASGVVKNDDVVILASQAFVQNVPPEKLLNTSVSMDNLSLDCAALLIKVEVDTRFGETEVIDFGTKETSKKSDSNFKKKLADIVTKFKNTFIKSKGASDLDIRLKRGMGRREKVTTIAVIAGILFVASILFTALLNSKSQDKKDEKANKSDQVSNVDGEVASASNETPDTSKDEEFKIKRITPTAFYDISMVDVSANPTSIAVLKDTVVVADKTSGKVYESSTSTPKFTSLEPTFAGISHLENVDGDLGFRDTEGYKFYNSGSAKIVDSFKIGNLDVTATYLGNVYSIEGDTLTKHTKDSNTVWAQNEDLKGAKSMSIAVSIFVLKDNELLSFTKGVKDDFKITGLDKGLSNAVQVVTSYDFDNIYIADAGNFRVVVTDKTGKVVAQYINKSTDSWKNIKSIGVSSDEKSLFLLDGTRVYQISL